MSHRNAPLPKTARATPGIRKAAVLVPAGVLLAALTFAAPTISAAITPAASTEPTAKTAIAAPAAQAVQTAHATQAARTKAAAAKAAAAKAKAVRAVQKTTRAAVKPKAAPAAPKPAPAPITRAAAPAPKPAPAAPAVAAPGQTVIRTGYTTGYTYFDNTPAGSATISNQILHRRAGGTGTYADPVTVAVGHSLATGRDVLDYPAGTRMYMPDVRRYFIVEDTCGDGSAPQSMPCHMGANADGSGSTTWVDLWLGGNGGTAAALDACAGKVTDGDGSLHTIVLNPASNYVVAPGAGVWHDGKCDAGYGSVLTTR